MMNIISDGQEHFKEYIMSYPNLEDVIKHDKFMREVYRKELGKDFESLKDGVCTGYVQGELDV